ncbi:ABC-type transport auxiliary lipoprotein family protein [Microvirga alba]|uniref:Membrane integrity-associated transporter subunit PqiC n=1 Tax=Microvirga alba TaxID=2791025 RepID=A0A931BPV1_9HYPH|nr:ABC-type transport auxiliary lipoprotein family protein [Microvirga alba]MBF9233469.1 membrane integrity-associated transporter subunit PqiC [Microvirga alba]
MSGSPVFLSPIQCIRRFGRLAPALLVAGLAGACSSSAPAPTTFDLSAPTAKVRGNPGVQVQVAEPVALQVLSAQQIIVKDAYGTISFLGGGQWSDNLPRLIQTRLINTFENSSQLRNVSRPSSGAAADAQLISELRSFEIATPQNEAVVEISVKLVSEPNGRIVNGRIFRARIPAGAAEAGYAVRALDEALSIVMVDIVRWVSGTSIPRRDEVSQATNSPPV